MPRLTLPLASLRELEEQLRLAREALAAARRNLDEGRPTTAAVELDRIDSRLGIGREVVHDLLETVGQAVERAPSADRVRLATIVAAWVENARRACTASGIELVSSPDLDGHLELDAAKVRRLLDHLVSAALVRGSGRLALRASLDPAGPSRALLILEASRQPPPRAAEPTHAELLAQRIAQVLGGVFEKRLDADGIALVFRAIVPVRLLPPSESTAEPVRLAGARVLVVEDDDDARAALTLLLEDWELDVASAGSYEEALSAFGPGKFRLALLDVDLNGRSGFELHQKLAQRQPSLPVIFLSGSDSKRGLATGPQVRYLLKPVDVTALESSIRELIEATALAVGADH